MNAQLSSHVDVVILCGGFGKRLKNLTKNKPKSLVDIGSHPFLDYLLSSLKLQGFNRFILAAGYRSSQLTELYRVKEDPGAVIFSVEKTPLGTGGAVRKTKKLIKAPFFLVLNGDSLCRFDITALLKFHNKKKAVATIVIKRPTAENIDFGGVKIDAERRVRGFKEKVDDSAQRWFNTGCYLFSREIFDLMPSKRKFSLEYDLFPNLLKKRFFAFPTRSFFIDMGTPCSLKKVREILPNILKI